jgi:hypothetical protein
MSCPVVVAIKEIYGSGVYDTDQPTYIVGGNDVVIDDVTFYTSMRKLTLARFELKKPDANACAVFYTRHFAHIAGKSHEDIKRLIIDAIPKHVLSTINNLIDLVEQLESSIVMKMENLSRELSTCNLNATLPSLTITTTDAIMYNTELVTTATNAIIDYNNTIQLTCLEDITVDIVDKLDAFTVESTGNISELVEAETSEQYFAVMHKMLQEEMVVAEYVKKIEQYHINAICKLNQVLKSLEKIINVL